ncbi:MAG: hypothetical protein AM326_00865 [Candidatus Thorarchaeota archaeon SMTZ-45]|nr:MAG: hypothetical protein AM326_00865 [Candidatus Thorarchaeota archaeon SMTZ-45]
MGKSKVYFTDRQARPDYNMIDKLEHIFNELGLDKEIKAGEKVMVKTHFGQWGNTNYLRPAYARKIVDLVRVAGGEPFLAETCGLGYGAGGAYGGRTTAPEYLAMATLHGYTEASVGAPLIMADGYWGTDVYDIEVDGEHVKSVDVAAAVFDCDKVIVLTHAKGHGLGGLGGTIKNLGIGLVGKRGKGAMHFMGDIKIDPEKCLGPDCSKCLKVCPPRCIKMSEKAEVDESRCVECHHCVDVCARVGARAATMSWRPNHEQSPIFVENSVGVIKAVGATKFYYINLAIDISDKCDCWNVGAPLLVHDIGIFGSRDPLAIDQATLQAIKDAPANPDSPAGDIECGACKFAVAHACKDPETGEILELAERQLSHAEKMGLGSRDYELVAITKEPPKREG